MNTIPRVQDQLTAVQGRTDCNVQLPTSIHQRILSFLYPTSSDRETLASCTLVCRAWREISQYTLYKEVMLEVPWRLASFCALLSNPPPAIAKLLPSVTQLCVCAEQEDDDIPMDSAEARVQNAALLPIVRRLCGLTHLMLFHADWRLQWFGSVFLVCPTSYFQAMTNLTLSDCSFTNIGQFHRLLLSFPALSVLVLQDIGIQEEAPTAELIPYGPRLKSLVLRRCDDNCLEIAERLIASGSVQTLSNLECTPGPSNSKQMKDMSLSRLLQEIGGTLESVKAKMYSFEPLNFLLWRSGLKSLDIHRHHSSPADMKEIITRLSSHQLEALHFNVELKANLPDSGGLWVCDLQPLQEFDEILSRPQFHRLKCCEVVVQVSLPSFDNSARLMDLHFTPLGTFTDSDGFPSEVDPAVQHLIDNEITYEDKLCVWVEEVRLKPAVHAVFKNCASRGILQVDGHIDH